VPENEDRTYGWQSDFPRFRHEEPRVIRASLEEFIQNASPEQIRAWRDSIPLLQKEAGELLDSEKQATQYTAILEYKLPLESRRPDFIVLLLGPVVVVELKGKDHPTQADLDQVTAYVRDLRAYHRECADRPVHAVLVPTRAAADEEIRDGVHIVGPAGLDKLLRAFAKSTASALTPEAFLREDAYRPLPTLVQAARELLESRSIRELWRSSSDTDRALEVVTRIAHEAAASQTRHLVLLTGVPGAGKTLVGLRFVHAKFLDDLAVEREHGKPTAPGLFLSGNGPLVQVLQHLLKSAGGGGKAFVRGVMDYLDSFVPYPMKTPDHHVLVFDEAQRAFDPATIERKHKDQWKKVRFLSEPAHIIDVAERIPKWCVVLGLVGTGQEIHVGEEAGIGQWRDAIKSSPKAGKWTVHAPQRLEAHFQGVGLSLRWEPSLNLDTEMRFHASREIHDWVEHVLEPDHEAQAAAVAARLHKTGYRILITRDLRQAKQYLWDRYEENADARFGLVASSKDKDLEGLGIPNDFQSTKRVKLGPWYGGEGEHSCRHLTTVVTEFGAQGLELDFALLCWGADFRREDGQWSNAEARKYKKGVIVREPLQLRKNAYRVLLTRGRDGTVIFVPDNPKMKETHQFLVDCGVMELK